MLCCNNSDENVCCCCIPIGNRGGEKTNTNNNINPINVEGGREEFFFAPKPNKNIRSTYHTKDE